MQNFILSHPVLLPHRPLLPHSDHCPPCLQERRTYQVSFEAYSYDIPRFLLTLLVRVETWVFEGLTTKFTLDPGKTSSVENFMK